jgi:hypothetical protein
MGGWLVWVRALASQYAALPHQKVLLKLDVVMVEAARKGRVKRVVLVAARRQAHGARADRFGVVVCVGLTSADGVARDRAVAMRADAVALDHLDLDARRVHRVRWAWRPRPGFSGLGQRPDQQRELRAGKPRRSRRAVPSTLTVFHSVSPDTHEQKRT